MNLKYPEIIMELANFHEGKVINIQKSIHFYNKLKYENKSIKFQVFKYSDISTKDYKWYETYKKLYISKLEWKNIFELVDNKKIWIDTFDKFSLEIIKDNIKSIYGLKIQPSILYNKILIEELLSINLKKKNIILNVSGIAKEKILEIKKIFPKNKFKKIIYQFGYQNYPTKLETMNIEKINLFKQAGIKDFSYADHSDGQSEFAKVLPTILFSKGYQFIEKHFCLNRSSTNLDFHSSLEPEEFLKMIQNIKNFVKLEKNKPFIAKEEKNYLNSTVQKLVLDKNKFKGNSIGIKDFSYKRTDKRALDIKILKRILKKSPTLNKNIFPGDKIKENYFKKKSKIGVFIVCRLKSTRLKNKALLKIGNKESIVHVIDQCLKIKNVHNILLATSYLKSDKLLVKLLKKKYKNKIQYILGHPQDIVQRILKGSKKYSIDTAVRVTGDCPVISPEIINFLIKKHNKTNSDFTYAKNFAVGTSAEIYSVGSLQHIKNKTKKASYSEYLPFYYLNNFSHFKINKCDLPEKYIAKFRLTLDYSKDLIFFNKLFEKLKLEKKPPTIINILKILRKNQHIAKINKHIKLNYTKDKFVKFICKKTKFKEVDTKIKKPLLGGTKIQIDNKFKFSNETNRNQINLKDNNKKLFVTFEIGPTHRGFESAKKLINVASKAGADAVKFQMVNASKLISDKEQNFSFKVLQDRKKERYKIISQKLYDILDRRKLSLSQWTVLKKMCDKKKLKFFATVSFEEDLLFLKKIGVKSVKISSGDINHLPLIKSAAKKNFEIELDTGMARLDEISNAIKIIEKEKNNKIIIHYCPKGYPAEIKDIKLKNILFLKKKFKYPVAFSDHSPGYDITLGAIAFGVKKIEKTLTENRLIKSPEHAFSIETKDAKKFVDFTKKFKKSLGEDIKSFSTNFKRKNPIRRSIFLEKDVKKGERLNLNNIFFSRPGFGITPDEFYRYKNKKFKKDFKKNKMIKPSDLFIK